MRLLLLGLLFVIDNVIGQVQVEGNYRPRAFTKTTLEDSIIVHVLPEQNNTRLALEDDELSNHPIKVPLRSFSSQTVDESLSEITDEIVEIGSEQIRKNRPYVFGKKVPLALNLNEEGSGEWSEDLETGTRHWRTVITSKGAFSLSLYFYEFELVAGAELYIMSDQEQLGAFTASVNNKVERVFSTAPIAGDIVVIEYIEPIETVPGSSTLVLGHVVHGFRSGSLTKDIKGGIGCADVCHINVACPLGDGWEKQISSVGILIINGGTSTCSGTMINNSKQDGRQLFLTAYHCIEDASDKQLANGIVGFNFQSLTCLRRSTDRDPGKDTVHGLKLLASSLYSDYALLQINEKIPDKYDVFLAGWNRTVKNSEGLFVGIHHPRGDLKKISGYLGTVKITRNKDIAPYPNFWQVDDWDKGVTEKGSSGSGLFNQKGQIIGHLLGGTSACDNLDGSDYYGAIGRDWRQKEPLSTFLDPLRTGKFAIDGEYLQVIRAKKPDAAGYEADDEDSGRRWFARGVKDPEKEKVPMTATVTVIEYLTNSRLIITQTVTAKTGYDVQ